MIASGATGGTSKGSIGKYFHLKDFGEALTKFNIDYKLVRETDYVVGFPTKQISKLISSKKKFKKLKTVNILFLFKKIIRLHSGCCPASFLSLTFYFLKDN